MDEFLIREATLSDKQAVLDCHTNVYNGFDYLPEFYDHSLRLNNAKSFVLLHGDKVVSYISFFLSLRKMCALICSAPSS